MHGSRAPPAGEHGLFVEHVSLTGLRLSETTDNSPLLDGLTDRGVRAAVVVAHPDDETLWSGGLILSHPACTWLILTLCRGSDPDRAPRFRRVLGRLGAHGAMGNLDDGPDQAPLRPESVESTVVDLLGGEHFDLLLTHGPDGEYTRHRRHEEVSRAVCALWSARRIRTDRLWLFAYEDGAGAHLPRAVPGAHRVVSLPTDIRQRKHALITAVYGFAPGSFEARTSPPVEAFWSFSTPSELSIWLRAKEDS